MDRRGMQPARLARLTWLAPESTSADAFVEVRARLERIAADPPTREVYTAKRRSIYRVDDRVLGALAVKEVRNRGPLRRLYFGYLQEHRALREFRVGATFAARGGRTPAFVAAALEQGLLGLSRVLLFLRWLDGAVTLTEHLRRLGCDPDDAVLGEIAACLVDAARLGLVHGRHSSENLLALPRAGGVDLYVIDFAYSRLGDGLDAAAFVADVARVAHRLLYDQVCSREAVLALFERVAALAWQDPASAAARLAQLVRALDAALARGQRAAGERSPLG